MMGFNDSRPDITVMVDWAALNWNQLSINESHHLGAASRDTKKSVNMLLYVNRSEMAY